jgi:molybdopterin molybdotransferase
MRPGKPLLVARRGRQWLVGLPGNPVSSYVTAFLFLVPLLRALLGAARPLPLRFRATLAAPLRPARSRREFLRANWDGCAITAHEMQDSGALAALAGSNALIDRDAGEPAARVGDPVSAYLLDTG